MFLYKKEIKILVDALEKSRGNKLFIDYGYGVLHGIEMANLQFVLEKVLVKNDTLLLVSHDPKPQMIRIRIASIVHCGKGVITILDENNKRQTMRFRTSTRGKPDQSIRHLPKGKLFS